MHRIEPRGPSSRFIGRRPITGRSLRWKVSVAAVALVAATVVIVRIEFLNTVTVSSDSMAPTLCTGDVVLMSRLDNGSAVNDGDIVTFTNPQGGAATIKRVVGSAGQRVAIKDAELFVDDRRVDEPYVDLASIDGTFTPTYTVPAGTVFVMGDHRETSIDSRAYGPIPTAAIDGRLLFKLGWSTCETR